MSESESMLMTFISNWEKNQFQEIKWINNNYPIRCPDCFNICIIDNIDIQNEKITIKCDNQHANVFYSFEDFLNKVIKVLNDIICNKCKSDNFLDLNNMERCNNCFLVFCKKCMSEHKEKEGHTNSIELDKIDTFCYRHNIRNEYFNNDSKYHICKECYNKLTEDKFIISIEDFIKTEEFFPNRNSINQEYKDVEKEIQICEKLINSLNDWKNNLLNKINKINDFLTNYYNLKKALIEHLINNDNYILFKNNYYVLSNYEMITQFKEIELYVHNSNNEIHKFRNENFYEKSKMFFKIIDNFSIKCHALNEDRIKNMMIEKNKLYIKKEKEKLKVKLSNMKSKNKYNFQCNINCFTVINDKYIIIGSETGDIVIYEPSNLNDEKVLNKKLIIKEFKSPIKFICEIDNNTIAVSDKISNVKIIELNEDLSNYSVIQEIKSEEQKPFHTMSHLPILTYYKNRIHFCMANSNYIFIYKSNKQPKSFLIFDSIQGINIEQPNFLNQDNDISKGIKENTQNNNDPFNFNLINKVILKTEAYSLIEINEEYMAAACISSDSNYSINFFNINNNFKLEKDLNSEVFCGGSYIMNLVDNRKVLIVGNTKGFCLISIKNFEIIESVELNMSIISIGALYDDTMICCAIDDKNLKKIIEIKYNESHRKIKLSNGFIKLENEAWDLKCFNKKIYFIFNSSINIFQK